MYTAELDIASTASAAMIQEFAVSHNCTAELLEEFGPAGGNPLYNFSSESYDCLEELVCQVLGSGCDEEFLKTVIVKS
jgi:hypothetical protein